MTLVAVATAALLFAGLLWAAAVSWLENETRAALRALILSFLVPAPLVILATARFPYQDLALGGLLCLLGLTALVFLIPTGRSRREEDDTPRTRIDERDIMFSRYYLEEGTERFASYYASRPENKEPDDHFRAQPGLMDKAGAAYDPITFSAAIASFATIAQMRPHVDGEVAAERALVDAGEMTEFLKSWAKKLGAVTARVTRLRDYHMYSHVGRGDQYGEPVELAHDYALALTVEMDKAMVDSAPLGPTVMESAQQYVDSGLISVQIAHFLRNLGYSARAHIDGNYRVVCPLVARDAGLGELGRMGLLMTPELGPRVRIGVVTTDMPLVGGERQYDETVTDFCNHCMKCADVCPSRAISFDEKIEIDGVRRWQIDSLACFTYWCKVGTDCARCVAVCPYSHPDNLLHNLVRRGVRSSVIFRRAAIWMDDFFYGKRPATVPPQDWLRVETGAEVGQDGRS